MNGKFPPNDTDHKNGIRDDNRWTNLRAATKNQNMANMRKHRNNKSGFKGVSFHKESRKWVAFIQLNGKNKSLGYFKKPIEAHKAYCEVADKHHGEFSNHG